jgi:hypothetical protein
MRERRAHELRDAETLYQSAGRSTVALGAISDALDVTSTS